MSLFTRVCLCVLFSVNLYGSQKQDDCSPIREQITHLSESGGEISIPEGQYFCSSPIILDRDNIWLHGIGKVDLLLTDMSNSPVIIMGDALTPPKKVNHVRVSDLYIDGNKAHQTEECWGGPCDEGGTTYIRNNGISVRAVVDSEIKNVFIKDGRSGGVVTERGCYNLHVDNLSVTGSEFDGFAGYQTYGSLFEGMHLYGNRAAGISIDIDFSKNTIRNTLLEKNGDVGIFMRDSRSNVFDSIVIKESGSHGVFVAQADNQNASTCATTNEFRDLSVMTSKGFGFQLNDPCLGNKLTGLVKFQSNQDGCIGEINKADIDVEGSLTCN